MRGLFVALGLCVFFCIPANAQDHQRAEMYGGYQLIIDDDLVDDITWGQDVLDEYKHLNGFSAAFEYNIRSWLGVVGELGHGRTSPALGGFEYWRNQTSFLFGPRVGYRGGRVRAFGHVLLGGNHVNHGIDFRDEIGEYSQHSTDFATALGGGLDIALGKMVSVRPVQLDLLSTFAESTQNQLRYSAGIVFRLGSVKN